MILISILNYDLLFQTPCVFISSYSSTICYQVIKNYELANSHFLLAGQKTYHWQNRLYILYKWLLMNLIGMGNKLKVS